jgi:hypothetical protein
LEFEPVDWRKLSCPILSSGLSATIVLRNYNGVWIKYEQIVIGSREKNRLRTSTITIEKVENLSIHMALHEEDATEENHDPNEQKD